MEIFKNGFLLGKFYGFHIGHAFLIESALTHCEHLTVLVATIPKEDISGVYRYEAVKEYFKDYSNVTVCHYDKYLPQEPSEDPHFWDKWIPVILKTCPDIDIVFASEDYAKDIVQNLGVNVAYKVIDKHRESVTISGTDIRNNPMKYYDYIAPTMRWYFNKKIAILGAESVGKSTMTKRLADYYRTSYAIEYGRIHCENNKRKLLDDDFVIITDEQQISIDTANRDAYKIMFSDTEALTTKVFLPKYCLKYANITEKYISQFIKKQEFDCYIVLSADNISTQDGTRNFLSDRQSHQEAIIKELDLYKKNYVVLTGSYEEKFLKAINICNKILI